MKILLWKIDQRRFLEKQKYFIQTALTIGMELGASSIATSYKKKFIGQHQTMLYLLEQFLQL